MEIKYTVENKENIFRGGKLVMVEQEASGYK
jgi:hypothetical protein